MPILLKNIEGLILDNFETTTILVKSVEGFYGGDNDCHYINIGGFEAFIQDFRYANDVTDFVVPPNFGLKNNTDFVTIEISY